MLRLTISAAINPKVCLYDQKAEKWDMLSNRNDITGEGICLLLQVFYQFAKNIDGGEVNSVWFQDAALVSTAASAGDYRKSSSASTLEERSKAIGMVCHKHDDNVILAIFHSAEASIPEMQEDCKRLHRIFVDKYSHKLRQLTNEINSLDAEQPSIPAEFSAKVASIFAPFHADVDNYIHRSSVSSAVEVVK